MLLDPKIPSNQNKLFSSTNWGEARASFTFSNTAPCRQGFSSEDCSAISFLLQCLRDVQLSSAKASSLPDTRPVLDHRIESIIPDHPFHDNPGTRLPHPLCNGSLPQTIIQSTRARYYGITIGVHLPLLSNRHSFLRQALSCHSCPFLVR